MDNQKLISIFRQYPDLLQNRDRFSGILRDVFPENKAQINQLVYAYDLGIVEEIQKKDLDSVLFDSLKKAMMARYRSDEKAAVWAVSTWFNTYGEAILGKHIMFALNAGGANPGSNPGNPCTNPADEPPLTPFQQAAVEAPEKRVAVIAGPGSGKTKVLTERIAYLVSVNAVPPEQILAVTFSTKAAREIRKRLLKKLGNAITCARVSTFHAFGLKIIRQNLDQVGLSEDFSILDNTQKKKYLRKILQKENTSETKIDEFVSVISKIKNGDASSDQLINRVYDEYNLAIRGANCVDLDDLVALAVEILKNNQGIREAFQSRYTHVLIDEVQDLNSSQIEMVNLLINGDTSFFAVGDDDQCIYEWRGAKPNYLKQLTSNNTCTVITLEDNFRSNKGIVDISGSLIANNSNRISKRMKSKKAIPNIKVNANAICARRFRSDEEEALFIAQEIADLYDKGRRYSDMAILVRGVRQVPTITSALTRLQIPYFEQTAEMTVYDEITSLLRAITRLRNKNTLNKAINFPVQIMDTFLFQDLCDQFGIDATLPVYDSFGALCKVNGSFENSDAFRARYALLTGLFATYQTKSVVEILRELHACYAVEPLAMKDKVQEKLGHLEKLTEIAKDFDDVYDNVTENKPRLEEFIDYLTLAALDDSAERAEEDGVNIMTAHKAKGLEFPVVFVPGVQVGVFPNDYFVDSKDKLEAERRLFYVCVTRAIEKLYLTCFADPFMGKGSVVKKGFLAEIPGIRVC